MTSTSDQFLGAAWLAPASRPPHVAPEVDAELVAAFRTRGDLEAFARLVDRWNTYLRPFVYRLLAGEGSTDRALQATYEHSFRLLANRAPDLDLDLWLHRLAYQAVIDELHHASTDPPSTTVPPVWRRLAIDQRTLAVMVDLAHYRIDEASCVLEMDVGMAATRLRAARRRLAGAVPPAAGREAVDLATGNDPASAVREVLAGVEVARPCPDFWPMLARRLVATHAAPDAAAPDPPAPPVRTDEPRRARSRRRRLWAGLVAIIVVHVVCLLAAVWIGVRLRTPGGSLASEVAASVSTAMSTGPYRRVEADVIEEDASGRALEREAVVLFADDGSWVVSQTGTIDQTTYHAVNGTRRRARATGEGPAIALTVTDTIGLPAGPPDPSPPAPSPLYELQLVPALLRLAGHERLPRRAVEDHWVWELDITLPTGAGRSDEHWRVVVDSATSLPRSVTRTLGDRLVRRVEVVSWNTVAKLPDDTFVQPLPDGTEPAASSHGFVSTALADVPAPGRGEPAIPSWLPDGFELTVVAVRAQPPVGAQSTGSGKNPPDETVTSLGFQRGLERITFTTRSAGPDPAEWSSPFSVTLTDEPPRVVDRGRFKGSSARSGTDLFGRAHLWMVAGDTVLTVSGDLTAEDAFQIVAWTR